MIKIVQDFVHGLGAETGIAVVDEGSPTMRFVDQPRVLTPETRSADTVQFLTPGKQHSESTTAKLKDSSDSANLVHDKASVREALHKLVAIIFSFIKYTPDFKIDRMCSWRAVGLVFGFGLVITSYLLMSVALLQDTLARGDDDRLVML